MFKMTTYYYYAWRNNSKRAALYKRPFRVLARGSMNSALVEFDGGQREIISRNAIRKMPSIVDGLWLPIKDGDPRAFALMKNHYSYQAYSDGRRQNLANRNRQLFIGPGEKMVLMTVDCDALFVWRKFIDKSGQSGVNCAVFRNESDYLASDLILEAEELAWQRWPGERLYTYVDARKIKSTNPGYCFKMAGWQYCGRSKSRRLHILEKLP